MFDVRPTSYPLLALALLCGSICFCGIMMALSVIGGTEQAAAGIGWGLSLPLSMLGGGMVPLFLMPEWMQRLANISPMKWTLMAYEGAIWRGFTPGEMLLPCAVLVAIGSRRFHARRQAPALGHGLNCWPVPCSSSARSTTT